MTSKSPKGKYPFRMVGVYLSAASIVMSVALALLLLSDSPILLLYYFVLTFLIAVATFVLRIRVLPTGMPKASEKESLETQKKISGWKILLIFCMLIVFLIVPLLLAGFLEPYVWFILMVSLTSGLSIAEILFYLSTR